MRTIFTARRKKLRVPVYYIRVFDRYDGVLEYVQHWDREEREYYEEDARATPEYGERSLYRINVRKH